MDLELRRMGLCFEVIPLPNLALVLYTHSSQISLHLM